jgi:precorrin-2 dehydrogenase / sirohydrochlorin ferrochelatase
MNLFPMFLKLQGRRCLVVGAGRVGESKIESLLGTGAELLVVSPRVTGRVAEWAAAGKLRWLPRRFRPKDLEQIFLVVAATSNLGVNELVFREASRRGVLCNAVDDPGRCDFFYPAVVRRGPLQIAISTCGQSPALAQRLRHDLEQEFGPAYEPWLNELGRARRALLERNMDAIQRKARLLHLASREAFNRFKRQTPRGRLE